MAISIVPHSEEYRSLVEAFNARMVAGGSSWGFYPDSIPDWIPFVPEATTWREYHLALENEEHVRGAYALKPQQWIIHGRSVQVADWQGPFTEADINPKYSMLMMRLERFAIKQYPKLFSLGHSAKDAEILSKLGWTLYQIPFSFIPTKPFNFLRLNTYLRSTRWRGLVLDLLAYTGAGWVGSKLLSCLRMMQSGRVDAKWDLVEKFGNWADVLWEENNRAYDAIAVRDAQVMNALIPESGWPGGQRLKISVGGEVVGWAVVMQRQMENDARFGNMNVGLIADCFAHPRYAKHVIYAANQYLVALGVDMICANMSHPAWLRAMTELGFIHLENRRICAFSNEFNKELNADGDFFANMHVTNLDGHGPHGFNEQ